MEETKDLEHYVQAAFNLTEEEHQKLLRRSVEAKVEIIMMFCLCYYALSIETQVIG